MSVLGNVIITSYGTEKREETYSDEAADFLSVFDIREEDIFGYTGDNSRSIEGHSNCARGEERRDDTRFFEPNGKMNSIKDIYEAIQVTARSLEFWSSSWDGHGVEKSLPVCLFPAASKLRKVYLALLVLVAQFL